MWPDMAQQLTFIQLYILDLDILHLLLSFFHSIVPLITQFDLISINSISLGLASVLFVVYV